MGTKNKKKINIKQGRKSGKSHVRRGMKDLEKKSHQHQVRKGESFYSPSRAMTAVTLTVVINWCFEPASSRMSRPRKIREGIIQVECDLLLEN